MGGSWRRTGALAVAAGALVIAAQALGETIEPDPTFSDDGIVTVDGPASLGDDIEDIAVLPSGKVVAAGRMRTAGGGSDFAAIRLNADGSLDATFGGDGIVTTDIDGSASSDRAFGLAVQEDGKVVLAGRTTPDTVGADEDIALVRYEADGTLDDDDAEDDGFGGDGIVIAAASATANDWANDVVVDGAGRVATVGSIWEGETVEEFEQDFLFARLTPDGVPDTSFDGDSGTGNGFVPVSFASDNFAFEEGYGIDLMDDGDLVAAGSVYTGDSPASQDDQIGLARLNSANGTLDTSFGGDGRVITDPAEGAFASGVATSPGKLTVVGSVGSDVFLARYDQSDGDLDSSLDGDGIATTPGSAFGGTQANGTDLALDGAAYVVSATVRGLPTEEDLAVARYSDDGSLDSDFGGDGTVTASTAPVTGFERAFTVAVVDDGDATTLNKVVVGGETTPDEPEQLDMVVARFGPDVTPPVTTISKPKAGRTTDRTPTLRFTVSEEATSRCRIDSKAWVEECTSPHTFRRQAPGRHVVRVQSTDLEGNVEAPPARRAFKIVR
jgi:uncharacterized delta-60 repeat protein